MAVTKVRSHYGSLSQIAQSFGREAENTRRSTANIKSKMEQLKGGDWKGDAANKFYAEMDGAVLPALNKLGNALETAGEITKKISSLMKNAEQESSKVFILVVDGSGQSDGAGASAGASAGAGAGASAGASAGAGDLAAAGAGAAAGAVAGATAGAAADHAAGHADHAGGGSSGGGGGSSGGGAGGAPSSAGASTTPSSTPTSGGGGGSSGGSSGGGGGGATTSPGSAAGGGPSNAGVGSSNPLVSQNPAQVFSPANLSNLANSNIAGAGSPELQDAMKELAQNPTPTGAALDKVLAKIAKLRKRPLNEIKAEFEKFLKVRAQAAQTAADKGLPPPPPLSDSLQDSFLGSEQELRSGELVGETFGIDPVFGAMLNPSGGLNANGSIPVTNSAQGLDDAAGNAAVYLATFHNVGPGANYLGAGNDNLAFWQQKLVDTLSNA